MFEVGDYVIYGTKDKKFLLGLFSMAISQINKMIKPNVKLYEDD